MASANRDNSGKKIHSSTNPDEFFDFDILSCDIYFPPQRQDSGYFSQMSTQRNKKHSRSTSRPVNKPNIVENFEQKLSKANLDEEAESFVKNPTRDNIYYPNFEYFEEKLTATKKLPDMKKLLMQLLKIELEHVDKQNAIKEAELSPVSAIICAAERDSISPTISEPLLDSPKDELVEKTTRSASPDLFEGCEDECLNTQVPITIGGHLGDRDCIMSEAAGQILPAQSTDVFKATENIESLCETSEPNSNQRREYTRFNQSRTDSLIKAIEELLLEQLKNLVVGKPAEISIRDTSKWENCSLDVNTQTLRTLKSAKFRKISITNLNSEHKFSVLMHILSEVYCLLVTGTSCTPRELYYRDPEFFGDQTKVNNAIKDIACLLDAAPWELGVLSSSKGLIAGSLIITLANDDIIDCSTNSGATIVPHDATGIKSLESCAEYVLIVEKDAVFEKLLNQDILSCLGREIILVTGKGYPDINTQVLLKKIHTQLKIPIYALFDADPYGIDILLVYRHGSRAMSFNPDPLGCPEIRWIGIFPSEIDALAIPSIPLSRDDKKKLRDLQTRHYISEDLKQELFQMQRCNRKAEIEGVSGFSTFYLISEYIPNKIRRNLTI